MWPASPMLRAASDRISISVYKSDRRQTRSLLSECRVDQFDRVFARPFGGSSDGGNLATLSVDQQSRRHAKGAADWFQILECPSASICVEGEPCDPDLVQPGSRLVAVAGVDINRDDLEFWSAQPLLECVQCGHLLAAGHTPGGPQVEQHRASAPVLHS